MSLKLNRILSELIKCDLRFTVIQNRCLATSPGLNSDPFLTKEDELSSFQYKKTRELLRNLLVLKTCTNKKFVDNSIPLYKYSSKVVGQKTINALIKPTFYSQFVGGDSEEDFLKLMEKLREQNLRLMLLPLYEDELDETDTRAEKFDKVSNRLIHLSDMAKKTGGKDALMQVKITAMLPQLLIMKLNDLVDSSTSLCELVGHCSDAMNRGKKTNILSKLSQEDNDTLGEVLQRLKTLGDRCNENGIRMLIDAEYTLQNDGINLLALTMMARYNTVKPLVWNTYQCYLKATEQRVLRSLAVCNHFNTCFGAKIVRGAYMDTERAFAKEKGVESPVQDTYEDTSNNYNKVIGLMLDTVASCPRRCEFVIATMNKDSVGKAAEGIKQRGIDINGGQVHFAQIYGMGDFLSVPIAARNFPTYKSVPFGGVNDAMLYLARRAQENKSVMNGARDELPLLQEELRNRLKFKKTTKE